MDIKPQTFFIGVVDFFSVLLPGGLLTYFLVGMFYDDIFGSDKIFPAPANATAQWVIFLIVTYIIGNIIFLLASFLDKTYDQFLRKRFFSTSYDLSYKTARAIRNKFINSNEWVAALFLSEMIDTEKYKKIINDPDCEIYNTYKWCQDYLQFNSPEALAEVKKVEADSKFFRSLVVTFLIIAILLLLQQKFVYPLVFMFIAALCYYRFGDLRFKATEKAYQLIIARYCLQPQQGIVTDGVSVSVSLLKTELTGEFLKKYKDHIAYLVAGFKKPIKQISVKPGEFKDTLFTNDTNGTWCCLGGECVLEQRMVDGGKTITYLMPGATLPVKKGTEYSFNKIFNESLDCIIVDN